LIVATAANTQELTMSGDTLAMRHLRLWLRPLGRVLATAIEHQQAAAKQIGPADVRAGCITERHASELLAQAVREGSHGFLQLPPLRLTDSEAAAERALIELARKRGVELPIARLRAEGLEEVEWIMLLIAAAGEISVAFGRLYGYLVDDLTRCAPGVELMLRLTSGDETPQWRRRRMLDRQARLRRSGLLIAEADRSGAELRSRLQLGNGVFAWLTGACATLPCRLEDPDLIAPRIEDFELRDDPDVTTAVALLRSGGAIGVWGGSAEGVGDVALGLAAAADRLVYRCSASGDRRLDLFEAALACAAHHEAALWINADALGRDASPSELDAIGARLADVSVPVLICGRIPWRPRELLERGRYTELRVAKLGGRVHRSDVTSSPFDHYRFDWAERRTALALARTSAPGVNEDHEFNDALARACRLVAAPAGGRFVEVIEPSRGIEDLILAAELRRQVLQIASFYKSAPQVDSSWGFGHMTAGRGGLKVLFTGEPGTGKTLAAEVIAAAAGRSLLRVDLSQVVSKWVGETEKNLEQVFAHAEDSHAVLFFDEADTLFGKRGEIRHGTDRYSNLEVGYLLQRLETFSGLAVLASNLRDEIDPALTRRFQVTLHFPRPALPERRRLWALAFARGAAIDGAVDLDELAQLDLTGAAIMSASRLAGLLAAAESSETIRLEHIGEAISRQFRQEARLLRGRAIGVLRLEHGAAS
jgi:hypothetical protein